MPIDDYSSSWQEFASTIKPDVDVEKKIILKKIRRDGCDFSVDYKANAEHDSAKQVDKNNPYIRNFTTQMRAYSPELNEFFDDFAIDIIRPDSISWEEAEGGICYETKYLCHGSMNQDSFQRSVRKVTITGKKLADDLIEFTMSNLVLSRVAIELRQAEPQPEASGLFGKLRSKLKK